MPTPYASTPFASSPSMSMTDMGAGAFSPAVGGFSPAVGGFSPSYSPSYNPTSGSYGTGGDFGATSPAYCKYRNVVLLVLVSFSISNITFCSSPYEPSLQPNKSSLFAN